MPHWALVLPLVTALPGFAIYQILTRKVAGTPSQTSVAMLFHPGLGRGRAGDRGGALLLAPDRPARLAADGGHGRAWRGRASAPIRALTIAPASLLAPFVYTQIAWALVLGYLVFGDMPDGWMLLGGAVIFASGLYVFYREAVLGRS